MRLGGEDRVELTLGIAEHTGQDPETIERDSDRDRWFTADEAKDYGIIDEVIPEPPGGAHLDPEAAAQAVGEAIVRNLDELVGKDVEVLVEERREKYYAMGEWEERVDA